MFGIRETENFEVPFFVTNEKLNQPIIGYNVIEYVVVSGEILGLPELMKSIFPIGSGQKAEDMVNWIRISSGISKSVSKTCKRMVVPPYSQCHVKCKTSIEFSEPEPLYSPEMFESGLEFKESLSKINLCRSPFLHVIMTNPTEV